MENRLKTLMFEINIRKFVFLALFWLIALQSAVIAAYENPLELSTDIHCEQQHSSAHHDCCLDEMANNHCNSCFQTTLALTTTENLPSANMVFYQIIATTDEFHPEPLLELFKPPI